MSDRPLLSPVSGAGRARRSVALDLVRVLGATGVVVCHHWAADSEVVAALTYSWAVSVFFVLSGYLWKSGRALGPDTRARARTLLVPFLAWTLVILAAMIALKTATSGFPLEMVGHVAWGGALADGMFAPLWFLPVLFFVAVYLRVMERFPRWVVWFLAVASVIAMSWFGPEIALAPHSVGLTIPCSLFVLAGQELRRFESRLPARVPVALAVLAGCLVVLLAGWVEPFDLKIGEVGTPVLSFVIGTTLPAAIIVLANAWIGQRRPRWGAAATALAAVAIVVLATHIPMLRLTGALGAPDWLSFVATLVLCWGLGLVLHRTRLSPLLVGAPQRARSDRALTWTGS